MVGNGNGVTRLLVVSQDSAVLRPLWSMAESRCWQMNTVFDAEAAIVKVQSGITLDLLVLDLPKDHADGLEILHMFRRSRPTLPVVLIGHSGDVHRKQESIRVGARGYLMRPLEDHQLDAVILESLSGVDDTTETDIASGDVDLWGHKSLRSLLQRVKEETEKSAIAMALEKTGWNRKAAARLLKTSYRSVLYKIEQYQLSSPEFSSFPQSDDLTPAKLGPQGISHADVSVSDQSRKAVGRSSDT